MNILALDTSTSILSIALRTDKGYEERLVDGPFSHSEDLLPEIEKLLARFSLDISELSLIIVAKGPGSFTGLRIGMASAKGIASALSIPVVSVPTLDAIYEAVSFYPGAVISVIDAKKRKFYLAAKKDHQTLIEDRDGNVEDVLPLIGNEKLPVLITGPDAALFASKLPEGTGYIIDSGSPRNISKALIALGLKKLEEDGPDDIGEGPVYIRRSDAEEALQKKMEESRNA